MELNVPRFSALSKSDGILSASNPAVRGLRRAQADLDRFAPYQLDPIGYVSEFLGFTPWEGMNGNAGQAELYRDIAESIGLQLEGKPARRWFKVDAGHGVGKTYGAAGLVNWAFDAFTPAIIMTTAPSGDQVKLLLWKDIKAMRAKMKDAPGVTLELMLRKGPNHWAVGRTVSDSGGKGTERFQGQHGPFLFFVLDEAEGVPPFVFNAVDAMMTGGVGICLMLANPKTRISTYHKMGSRPGVSCYRLSVLDHPNVVTGSEVVPHGPTRAWVEEKIETLCEETTEHDPDAFTFEVGWRPGVIFKPQPEFLWRVMGIAPPNDGVDSLIPPGRYEAATKRKPEPNETDRATIGVDCARDGSDKGTIYAAHNGAAWRHAQVAHGDTFAYVGRIKALAEALKAKGVKKLHIRVDGTGGYGSGVIDVLLADTALKKQFEQFRVFEVQFGSKAHDAEAYADLVTEMYAATAEVLKKAAILKPPAELEADLTERRYKWKGVGGRYVKKLEEKDAFKSRVDRSPDDGDGLVLALAPDHLFNSTLTRMQALGRM